MKQVLQSYRTGELTVAEVPAPGVSPGCLLVLTAASLVSVGTDRGTLELSQKSLLGKARERPDLVRKVLDKVAREGVVAAGKAAFTKLDQPIPLGYSCTGRVLAVGEGVTGFSAGDRVACAGAKAASHAELNLVPQNLCALVPEGVSDETAAFVTLGAIALHGVRQAQPTLGESFAVIGLGLIGQLALQLLKASGCSVLGVDLDPLKVKLALELGADAALVREGAVLEAAQGLSGGRGLDGVIVAAASASSDPIQLAGDLCRDRARVVALGAVGMEVPRRPYYDKELTLLQSRSYGPGRYDPTYEEHGVDYPVGYVRWTEGRNLEAFLAQCAQGRVRTGPLVSHRFPIERAGEAYALIQTEAGKDALGVLLTYSASEAPSRTVRVHPQLPARGEALRVGVVGAGNFAAGVLVPELARLADVQLGAIASSRGVTARHLAEKFGIAQASSDAEALLQDPQLDAVVIATRHGQHAEFAARALLAGKHVFVEKPLALDEAGLAQVLSAARESGRVLAVGYNRRFAPLTLRLRDHFAGRRSPLVIQLRVNAGALPEGSWIHHPREGGGRIVGEACHFIDLCAFIAGAAPVSVFAQGVLAEGGARADDNVILSLRFADGSIGTIAYVATGDPSLGKERLEVLGDSASAVLEDFRTLELRRGGKRRTSRSLVQDKGHRAELAAFVAAARAGGPGPIPLGELAAVSRATFSALESLRTGAPIELLREP